MGNFFSTTDGLKHVTEQYYDASGNVAVTVDGKKNRTVYKYNELGKLKSVSLLEYDSTIEKVDVFKSCTDLTEYIYDVNGNLETQKFQGSLGASFTYNDRNLLKEKVYPGSANNKVKYYYYDDGSLKKVIDRKNITTSYDYYPQGWTAKEKAALIEAGVEKSSTTREYNYDNNGNVLEAKVTSARTPDAEIITRTYDELNRVDSKTVSNIDTVSYCYDLINSEGKLGETVIDPKRNMTSKLYDAAGRVEYVKDGNIEAAYVAQYIYNKNGSTKEVQYSTGAKEIYDYHANGLLFKLTNTSGTNFSNSYEYQYYENNNIKSKTDLKGETKYFYDAQNRLNCVDETYVGGAKTEYTYDEFGNRDIVTITKDGIIVNEDYDYTTNLLDTITVTTSNVTVTTSNVKDKVYHYSYDANGNQVESYTEKYTNGNPSGTADKVTNTYDEFNQLLSSNSVVNTYNAEGYRVSKNSNGTLTRYLYEFDKVVLEVNAAGEETGRNIYGTNLLSRTVTEGTNKTTLYYMYNGHADVTALIDATEGSSTKGQVVGSYYYDAFGNITDSSGSMKDKNSILYAGYQYDSETKLYYLNARMYDPKIARFLQEDTYRGDSKDPLSLNLYTYCSNNPLIYFDPTGHAYVYIPGYVEKPGKNYEYKPGYVQKPGEAKKSLPSAEEVLKLNTLLNVYEDEVQKVQGYKLLGDKTDKTSWSVAKNFSLKSSPYAFVDTENDIAQSYTNLQYLQYLLLENKALKQNKDIYEQLVYACMYGNVMNSSEVEYLRWQLLSDDRSQAIIEADFKRELQKAGMQVLKGSNYTKDEDITELGTYSETLVGLGGSLIGADTPLDVRDFSGDIKNWKWTPGHVGGTVLDGIAVVPLIGAAKPLANMGTVFKAANKADMLDEVKDVSKNVSKLGTYDNVKGHHLHAKKSFEGNIDYDPKTTGLCINKEYIKARGWDHGKITGMQKKLYIAFAKSGKEATLEEFSRIERLALQAGDVPEDEAAIMVAMSLKQLTDSGITKPTYIPWVGPINK